MEADSIGQPQRLFRRQDGSLGWKAIPVIRRSLGLPAHKTQVAPLLSYFRHAALQCAEAPKVTILWVDE